MNKFITNFRKLTSLSLVIALSFMFVFAGGVNAQSAIPDQFYNIDDLLTYTTTGTTSVQSITFNTPTGIAVGSTTVITFPVGSFNVSGVGVGSGWTLGTVTANTVSVIKDTSAVLPLGLASITLTGIVNPAVAGQYMVGIAVTGGDVGEVQVNIVGDGQVHIVGKVQEVLKFSIDDNKIGFGSFTSGAVRYATPTLLGATASSSTTGNNITVGTNATGGYFLAYTGTTLTDGTKTIAAAGATATTSNPGTEQFGIQLSKSGTGTATVAAAYDGTTLPGGFAFTAAGAQVVSSVVATDDNVFKVNYLANIRTLTPAGDYATTLTFAVTASF